MASALGRAGSRLGRLQLASAEAGAANPAVLVLEGTGAITSFGERGTTAFTLVGAFNSLSDFGTATLSTAQSGSETRLDATTSVATLVPSSATTTVDAGSATLSLTPATSFDAAGVSFQFVTSGQDSATETVLLGVAASGAQTVVDATSTALVLAESGSTVATDASTAMVSLAPAGADARGDASAASLTLFAPFATFDDSIATYDDLFVTYEGAFVQVESDSQADAGTAALSLTATAAETEIDATTAVATLVPAGSDFSSESQSVVGSLTGSGTETVLDAGSDRFILEEEPPPEAEADVGTDTFLIVEFATETLIEAAATSYALDPAGSDASADAQTLAAILTPAGDDAAFDETTDALLLEAYAAEADGTDNATSTLSLELSGEETVIDASFEDVVVAGTDTFTLEGTGDEHSIDASIGLLEIHVAGRELRGRLMYIHEDFEEDQEEVWQRDGEIVIWTPEGVETPC